MSCSHQPVGTCVNCQIVGERVSYALEAERKQEEQVRRTHAGHPGPVGSCEATSCRSRRASRAA